jgi:hypothetical protein
MGEALILEGSADTTAFEIYIEQILAPSLQAGQIVILDKPFSRSPLTMPLFVVYSL